MISKDSRNVNNNFVAIDLALLRGNSQFDKRFTNIGSVLSNGVCVRDHPDGVWGFPFVTQMETLKEFYAAAVQYVCMHVDCNEM